MASTTGPRTPTSQITGTDSLAVSIVEAIASARGTEPTAVDVRLADYVDLDALETLYHHSDAHDATWRVQFSVEELEVVVESDGQVTVY